jgi:hypothetical protein
MYHLDVLSNFICCQPGVTHHPSVRREENVEMVIFHTRLEEDHGAEPVSEDLAENLEGCTSYTSAVPDDVTHLHCCSKIVRDIHPASPSDVRIFKRFSVTCNTRRESPLLTASET